MFLKSVGALLVASILFTHSGVAAANEPITTSFAVVGIDDKTGTVVADPAAASQKALAVNLAVNPRTYEFLATPTELEAGRYRVTFYLRLRHKPEVDISRLQLSLTAEWDKGVRQTKELVWTQFDTTADRYTPFTIETTLAKTCKPKFHLTWQQVFVGANAITRPLQEVNPTTTELDAVFTAPKVVAGSNELAAEINNADTGASLDSVTYPVALFDRVTFEPLSRTQWIQSVFPQFLHVYPGAANPVSVELRNQENRTVDAVAQLEIRTGLNEVLHTASQPVSLPPRSTTSCKFEWSSGKREFGHEARVTLLVDGKPIDAAGEYFSVSDPIWKTALQGSGFLGWYGREKELPGHVSHNRKTYQNVEEAFSWQPSSWTDLNPTTDEWWTGQGNVHNSMAGLKQWIGLSHEQGIKMITYLWPTASGPIGMEWVRQNPEQVIFSGGNFDVEDLRLKPIVDANPMWKRLYGGTWNHIYVNRGMLRGIEKGVAETIASAKAFGWDGARFDKPPGWFGMPAEVVHSEFKQLHVEELMQRLIPEHYSQTTGTWSNEAVSLANVRYVKHRFHEHDPHFAISYNGAVGKGHRGPSPSLDEMAADGGQGMNEAMRLMAAAPWRDYLMQAREEADLAHERGGFHCVVKPDAVGAALRLYAGLSVLIAGSHPYGDFGWGGPLPGTYSQFVTRYGEYCWSQDLRPTTAEAASFSIAGDEKLWWRELLKHRRTAEGDEQWIVHLLSNPPTEKMSAPKPGTITPWQRGLVVGRKSEREPTVWALTAEPSTRAERLPTRRDGDRYVVEIPEHRVWTILVWTEAQK